MRFALLCLSILGACKGYDPDLGGSPFLCGSEEPKCPDGYECKDDGTGRQVCFSSSGVIVDAAPSGFQCADDSILEGAGKNDTVSTAYSTPVATQRPDISFAGLAICPEGDKDTYKIDVTTGNSNVEVITSWDSGMPVSVSLLNGSGSSINNGTSNGEKSLRAYAANLPVGTFYAQAYAAATTKNNYKITIKVTQ
ncbi:MAG: hypothetical protein H0T46_03410 [Deltaproteobacteria bacterium]|nr:hypothetical protein [Deltaproteobacteria bacterium]